MVAVPSTMLPIGTPAPEFNLPDPDGTQVNLADFKGSKALVVMFICNHCPFVKHIKDGLVAFGRDYADKGVGIVAINSNDIEKYPDDAPDKMKLEGYPFAYVLDDSQAVAKAYRAACTPDFYVFDSEHQLVYRGQFDDARPSNEAPVTGDSLRAAVDAVLAGKPVPDTQTPSIGCNIKWKAGNEPDWFPKG